MEPQVFAILRLLIENHERVVTKDEIFDIVWKDRAVSDAALSSGIKVARAAVGDDGARQEVIRTVHGRGFHFVADITIASAEIPSVQPRAHTRPSLAVLPFQMLAPDAAQRAFGEGLEHDITTALGRIRALYLAANHGEADPRRVAVDLGVRYLLSVRLRFAGDAFRLSAALLDAEHMEEVWADTFSGTIDDTFLAQDRVTAAVMGALVPTIIEVEIGRAARQSAAPQTAYDAFLRAIPLCLTSHRAQNAEAVAHLKAALDRDTDYAHAHALLSWCYGQQLTYQWTEDPAAARDMSRDHAAIALRLATSDSLVLTFVANAETAARNHDAAEYHVRKALEFEPSSAWAWSRLGYVHLFRGESEPALEAFERALFLSPHDPMRHSVFFGLGATHFCRTDYATALRWLDQSMIENPDRVWIHRLVAACAAEIGDADRARASVAILRQSQPDATAESLATAIPITDDAFRARLLSSYKKAGL